jgi:hypothetical protein
MFFTECQVGASAYWEDMMDLGGWHRHAIVCLERIAAERMLSAH